MSLISRFLSFFFYSLITLAAGFLIITTASYLYLNPRLPSVESLREVKLQTPLRIYSDDHKLISEFGEKRRKPIPISQVPGGFVQAILAAEDNRFLQHHGVDIKGLLRAASQLAMTGQIQTGGSTITMQVAKNFFLSSEKTFSRKFNEIFLALQIERELNKEEILELYINKIYLGHRAYGIEAAANVYYGLSIDQLSTAQLAMIAGLPKAPSAYNPITNPVRALVRRNWILERMYKLGYITEQQFHVSRNEPITAKYHGLKTELNAPYVAEMARKELMSRFGRDVYTDGYTVNTTVNSRLQRSAEHAVTSGLMTYDERHGYRGPEAYFDASQEEEPLTYWQSALTKISALSGLEPAIVTAVEERSIQALLDTGKIVVVDWEHGLSSARPYVTINSRGPAPKSADFLRPGDLIRLKKDQHDNWHLSQVPAAQAALVSLNPDNGAILAMVGGFDFRQSKFNRVTQASRQPGSNFKPLVYAAALENGFTAASLINDAPLVFEDASLENTWRPANDSGKFYGPTRLREALYKSRNLVSIRLLRELGIENAVDYVSRFGFDPKALPHDLSLALGSHALTMLELVSAYAVFANGGYKVEPFLISEIYDNQGELVYRAKPPTVCADCSEEEAGNGQDNDAVTEDETGDSEEYANLEAILRADSSAQAAVPPPPPARRIIDPQVAYIMDNILHDVITKGTGRRARVLNRPDIAGKTGTTNGPTDAWFSGYQREVVTTTWLGFDQNQVLGNREYGGSAALPIWIEYMRTALKDVPVYQPQRPVGLTSVLIDPKTGKRARPGQADAIFEIFRTGRVPGKDSGAGSASSATNAEESQPLPEELF